MLTELPGYDTRMGRGYETCFLAKCVAPTHVQLWEIFKNQLTAQSVS